jgi:hypothetical protein
LVFGRDVILQTYGQDKYGRTLADVALPDGMNVNHELVKEGWCWWYRKYVPGDTILEGLEKKAQDFVGGQSGRGAHPVLLLALSRCFRYLSPAENGLQCPCVAPCGLFLYPSYSTPPCEAPVLLETIDSSCCAGLL